jgi:enterobacterial common antigen flippase
MQLGVDQTTTKATIMTRDSTSLLPAAPTPRDSDEGLSSTARYTYGQILRSSALVGGSQLVGIAIRIIRTKVLAVLLGPAGVGLMGAYESIVNLAQSVAGLGVNSSGVRQIAEAVGTGQSDRIAGTVAVLRRISVVLGLVGALFLVVFSKHVSKITFGDYHHSTAIALLSLAIFFGLVSGGQGALIQGMRRISDLARMGMIGTFFGAVIGILIVYFAGEKGIAPSLVTIAAMTVLTSWWYSRKVKVKHLPMRMLQIKHEVIGLLRLGIAFMASAVLMMASSYLVRTMVIRTAGFEAAGLYQSAWALGGLYVGFILQAMGADFYPRLTAIAKDNSESTRIVNEQAQVSLLLAGPGVIATLTFAPIVISLFYSGRFDGAVSVLRWFCLGMTLRVVTWPMGFIILARGEARFYFVTELIWAFINVGLSWVCLRRFGLNGAGIAFFVSYVFHGLIVYAVVHRISLFQWSAMNIKVGLLFLSLIGLTFGGFYLLPRFWPTLIGTLLMLLACVFSIRTLLGLVSVERVPRTLLRLFGRGGPVADHNAGAL